MSLRDIEYRVFYRPSDNPLESFYLPTLAASVQYDRSAGYFRSSALAVAAAGVVRLIANGGRMRLLVGAELSEQDVEAVRQGYDLRETAGRAMLAQLEGDGLVLDGPRQQRLDALTWMVAHDRMDIKVVLPLGRDGFPIPGPQAQDYYHTKKGVFTDAEGNQVSFVGSVNESEQAWVGNFEEFMVQCSWEGDRDRSAIADVRASFNELWEGHDPGWIAIDLPDAVRGELIKRAPAQPPTRDPLERAPSPLIKNGDPRLAAATPADRILFAYLRDAPYLLNAADLGAATSAINPWPHQLQVARTLLDRFPDRALLADEVGLGKTIEAGLIIRQLILSGRVGRCLILAPAAVLRQWQEELYEKFNLAIPRYHRRQLLDLQDQPIGPLTDNPWDECDILLASSHLARRRQQTEQLALARPWDLLVVDEAHHARRKDFLQPTYRPNRLLTLLNRLKDANRYHGLLLLTATPMQVHPVEVWDLLTVLGLSGRWGANETHFLNFFTELRRAVQDADWNYVYGLVDDYLQTMSLDGAVDPEFLKLMIDQLGRPHAEAISSLPGQPDAQERIRYLPKSTYSYVQEMARRHTPLQRYLFRNTRSLLREYVAKGLLNANVPYREPTIRRVRLSPAEAELYERITEYISEFYTRLEAEKRGLGFIMTVYRRRLTSSFYAVRRSLERRRDWLLGQLSEEAVYTEDDVVDLDELEELEQAGFDLYGNDEGSGHASGLKGDLSAELDYIDQFIGDLRTLSHGDSKTSQLKDELDKVFRKRPTVIIFTQYTDTMDYLREQLETVYRGKVACYSGRGGEVWNGIKWVVTTKEDVKEKFRLGEIQILLCTESASEGLNLQTCGVLINYDMPWNPMRVEQRIGRIDRIGQMYDKVWVYNYFYEDTIEDKIYRALEDRINWFESVVGSLQPILAEVSEMTKRLAMLPAAEQAAALDREIRALREMIDEAKLSALNLEEYADLEDPAGALVSPITLADIEQALTTSSATGAWFEPHPEIAGAYVLNRDGQQTAVTFRADVFDRHPNTLVFLSYGSPLLDALLEGVPAPDTLPPPVARFAAEGDSSPRAWYDLSAEPPQLIADVRQLRRLLSAGGNIATSDSLAAARRRFDLETAARQQAYEQRLGRLGQERANVLRARARELVLQAALVEIALGQRPSLFVDEVFPVSFSETAVVGLKRHKSPWSWMVYYTGQPLPRPSEPDPFYELIRNESSERLKARFDDLTDQANAVRKAWQAMES